VIRVKITMLTLMSAVFLTALITFGAVSAYETKDAGSIEVQNGDEAGFTDLAKISFDSAIKSATATVPGKVLKAELENENGYLVYCVEVVKSDRQIADIKVDAGNGKVLKIEKDQKDNEDSEVEDYDNSHEDADER
jgi:uncharacterized membrane protein YkoI